MITIAIDAMGGDIGPEVTVPAALQSLSEHLKLNLILVGDQSRLEACLANKPYDKNRLSIHHASQAVAMDESPSQALRTKKDSSMRVAINLVKEGKSDACVSAGNTGALMATARFVLKTLPGIDRPAIVSAFPTYLPNKKVRILDLGANVDSTAENLVEFAVMGAVLSAALDHTFKPKIYLLNIGAEEIKGNELVKQAHHLLSENKMLNYCGYIEGDALYKGEADVVVCDGFVGNVALKTTEGVAVLMSQMIKQAFMRNFLTKITGALVKPVLKPFVKRIDPAGYNGATLIGLQGTVIKSHGSANSNAFARAITEAILGVENNVPAKISAEVQKILQANPTHPPGDL